MERLLEIDGNILIWIQNNLRNSVLDPIMKCITYLGNAGAIWIILSIVFIAIPKTRKIGVVCACSLALTFLIDNVILKNIVARIRPYDAIENLNRLIGAQSDFSFPSGHSGSSFSVAVVMFREMPKKIGITALILAVLIALSRLYVGVHYPSDVLAGCIVGTIIALICCCVYHRISKSKNQPT